MCDAAVDYWVGKVVGRGGAGVYVVHVVFCLSSREADDETGHGHFDVEFYLHCGH